MKTYCGEDHGCDGHPCSERYGRCTSCEIKRLEGRVNQLEAAIEGWASVIVHGQNNAGITEMDAEKALLKCIKL